MTLVHASLIGAAALVVGLVPYQAQAAEKHIMLAPDSIEWGAAPAALPAGAEAAVLFGDPSASGQFALRIRMPDAYFIPPHTHPALENVTVISGTFLLGTGEIAEEEDAMALPAGSFVSLQPGTAHFGYADGETVVQLNSVGPWGLTYVDPADDPRKLN